MIEWDQFSARMNVDGMDVRERALARAKANIRTKALMSPACREVLVNGVPQHLLLKRTDGPTKVAFNTLPDEQLILGSVVYWQGSHWLVTESLLDDEMTFHGAMLQCNREVRWQNPKTREIISRWSVITKPYYSNLDEKIRITISSREFKVQLPYDAESSQLDVGKRFMLEVIDGQPVTYRITSTDMNSKRFDVDGQTQGFIILNIEQDQFNKDADNIEHMICNYLEPFSGLNETEGGWCIVETEAKGIIPGGLPINVTARYLDSNGQPLEGIETEWELQCSEEVKSSLTQQMKGSDLRLSLESNAMLIGQKITITASNPERTIHNSVQIKVVSAL